MAIVVVSESNQSQSVGSGVELYTNDGTAQAVNAWLLTRRSENTRAAYRRDVLHFLRWGSDISGDELDDIDLAAVTPTEIGAYARSMTAEGVKPATVNRRLAALSSFYRWAILNKLGGIVLNPAHGDFVERESGSSQHSASSALDETSVRTLIEAATEAGPRDLLIVLVLSHGGIRVTELIGAKVGDVRSDRGHCTLTVTGKGNKVRTVVLPPSACDLISDDEDAFLVAAEDGSQLNRHQVTRVLTRLRNRAGLDTKLTPHVLRATMITEALLAGVPLWVVQDTAGHSDPKTTRIYQRKAAVLDNSPTYALASRWA